MLDGILTGSVASDPAFQTVIAPFLVAFGLGALVRVAARGEAGPRFMGIAACVGFLVAYALFEGIPSFPPPTSKQKVFYLVALGAGMGFALDFARAPRLAARVLGLGFALLCVAWLAWRPLSAGPSIGFMAGALALWAGGALFLWRVARVDERDGALNAGILVVVAALGLAALAMQAASISLALLSLALASAVGALALWDYGAWVVSGRRRGFGAAAGLGAAGALVAIAGVLALYTQAASPPAMAVLLVVAFSDELARHLNTGSGAPGRALAPVMLGLVAAMPALAAVGLAHLLTGR